MNHQVPIVRLFSFIWNSYSIVGSQNDLDWRLRNQPGISTRTALSNYIRVNSPINSVKDLILSSQPITKDIASKLNISIEKLSLSDDEMVRRFLWKFGFPIPLYEDFYDRLRKNLEAFNEQIISVGCIQTEEDRERIRSAGVNVFVAIEQFLEELVVYNTWILASDHFIQTKFTFNFVEARQQTSKILGEGIGDAANRVCWDPNGENTLGTLLRYLQEVCNWQESLLNTDPAEFLRSEDDLPHYAEETERVFPFTHTATWADFNHSSLVGYVDEFKTITKQIMQSNLAGIRNGLDHKREVSRFPSIENMLAFVARFREAIDTADVRRFIPKSFYLESKKMDKFGQIEYTLRDYANRPLILYGPSVISSSRLIQFGIPYLIAPNDLLGQPNSPLIFKIVEKSTFSEYWKGYPRRRTLPPSDIQENSLVTDSASDSES